MADEEVSALRQQMIIAADEDEDANKAKRPGTSKLKLLPKVVNTLQKYAVPPTLLPVSHPVTYADPLFLFALPV